MNTRIAVLGGVAVIAVAAAFGAGYYLSRSPSPPPAVTQTNSAPIPAPVAGLTPPTPNNSWRDRPDPFAGQFATFPMRHAGDGSVAAPLTWSAVTEFGEGREA